MEGFYFIPSLIISEFLFIDLLLILPIAIFSKSTQLKKIDVILMINSGMDWTISNSLQKAPYCKSCLKKSLDSVAWPNCNLYSHPSYRLPSRTSTKLVCFYEVSFVLLLTYRWSGSFLPIWIVRNPTLKIPRIRHCS